MLDTSRLRVFRAVVATGSVQSAAANLGYTPSAVSQQISALQRETGLRLFEKSGRGIRPTSAARVLADESDQLMGSLARLDGVVEDLRVGRSGTLSIACFASAAQAWVPSVARTLRTEFPDVLVMLNLNEVGGRPSQESPDIDVRTETIDAPTTLPGYTRRELHEEGYVLLMRSDHPLVGRQRVVLTDFAAEPWIEEDLGTSTCGRIMRAAYRSAGFTPRCVARTEDHYTAASLVAAGVGVAAVPQLAVGLLPPQVRFRPLDEPAPRRRIVAFVRDGVEHTPAAARALALLEQEARSAARAARSRK
ncbi:MAG: LysR family transcriptional regulator [Marmoricola sp.]